ncbi:hypothetical protein D3C87_1829130 [compost metagenome]
MRLNLDLIMGPTQSAGGLRQNSMNCSASERRRSRSGLRATMSAQSSKRSTCVLKELKVDWLPAYDFKKLRTTK